MTSPHCAYVLVSQKGGRIARGIRNIMVLEDLS